MSDTINLSVLKANVDRIDGQNRVTIIQNEDQYDRIALLEKAVAVLLKTAGIDPTDLRQSMIDDGHTSTTPWTTAERRVQSLEEGIQRLAGMASKDQPYVPLV